MQINQQIIHQHQQAAPDAPLELKQGEVYRASIKEKLNDTDAILNIRGKDVHAKFADGVPATENRVTVLVDGQSDQMVNVKTIATENTKTTSNEEKIFSSLGLTGKGEADLKQAVRMLLDKGSPLSKEVVGELKAFMEQTKGSIDSKMETVRALANKRLEPTHIQLRAIHEALHGEPLNEVLSNIAKEIDPEFKLERTEVPSGRQPNPIPQKENTSAVKMAENQPVVESGLSKNVTESMKPSQSTQSAPTTNASELSDLVRKSRESIEKEPDLKKAIKQIREEIIKNPKVDRELAQQIEKVAQDAEKLQSIGKDRLVQVLKGAEEQLLRKEQSSIQTSSSVNELKVTAANGSQEVKLAAVVNDLKIEVSKNPNINQSIEKIREQVVENLRFSKEVAENVSRALNEASSLAKQGRMTTGKEVLSRVLTDVQNNVDQVEGRATQQVNSEQLKSGSGPRPERITIEARPSEVVKQVKAEVQSEPNLQRAVEKIREQVIANPKMDREVVQKVEQALREAIQLQKVGQETVGRDRVQQVLAKAEVELKQIESRQPAQVTQVTKTDLDTAEPRPSEVVKQVKAEVQTEPNLQRVVEKIREQVVANPKMDREIAQKVEQSLKEAVQLQRIGQESAGRDRVRQALAKAEVDLKQIETRQPTQAAQATLTDLDTVEPRPSEVVKQVKTEVQSEPNLQRAVEKVREQVVTNPKMDREIVQKVEQALKEAMQLQQIGRESTGRDRLQQVLAKAEVELKQIETRQPAQPTQPAQTDQDTVEPRPSEVVKQVKAEVQSEPNLQRAVEKVREQVVSNPRMDREVVQKVEQALKEAMQLQQIGRESTGRDRLQQALAKAEVELKQIETRQPVQTQASQTGLDTVEPRPSEVVKQVKTEIQSEPNLQRAVEKVREQVVAHPKMDREVAQKVEQALKEAVQLQKMGQESIGRDRVEQALTKAEVELKQIESRQPAQVTQASQTDLDTAEPRPSEMVKQVKAEVQSEPNLQRTVEKVREQVVANPKIDREVAQKVEQSLKEAVQLQKIGQESIGRNRVQQALTKAEVELKQIESRQPMQVTQTSQADQDTVESRPSEVIKQVRGEVQSEPFLQRAVEKVREQVVANPKMDREVAQKVEQVLKEAIQLQKIGQEPVGRAHLQQTLAKAETELKQIETRQISQQPVQMNQDSQLRESIKQVREQIQSEPDIQKILQKVQDLVTNNKNVDSETMRNIERIANQANQLDQAGRERLTKMLQQVETTLLKQNGIQQKAPENVFGTIQKEQPINHTQQQNNLIKNPEIVDQTKTNVIHPSESINQALKQLQREPNLEKALDQVRKEITSNPNIDLKTIDKAEKTLNQATQLQDKGRELGARQHITKELTEIQQELATTEPKINTEQKSLQEQMQYELNEQLQGLNIQSKDILVTKVTEKLAQATHDFRELKREITRNLDSVERVINTFKKNAYPQAKQMLETAISKLDNAILKSDMMLFTDMKTEKQLMNASTQLAEAKKLLAKGDHVETGKIVSEVKTLIDKLIFKPSEQKIMHYVNKESMLLGNSTPKQQMLSQYSEATHGTLNQEPSARQMYEMVRSLGLNHESDVANSLVFHKNDQFGQSQQEQQQQQNLKEVLMKLTQGEGQETNPKIVQQAEQALTNLTGQQLLSKSDASGTLQSMFFNFPLMLGGKPENLQVFINSKNEGQQVEWENCNLYFLLETKKLGDIGILLNSTDRNLSITIKNDLPGFKEKIEPLASFTKEKLQEVGYNVSSINFARINPVRSQPASHEEVGNEMKQVKETRQIFNEKGMNFTI